MTKICKVQSDSAIVALEHSEAVSTVTTEVQELDDWLYFTLKNGYGIMMSLLKSVRHIFGWIAWSANQVILCWMSGGQALK